MFHSYPHIYLSPHYDDASLSCGGAIHLQAQAGQAVLVVTICAAPPPSGEPLSPFAQSLHRTWGNPADVIATREAEDRASLAILGADYLRLNFNDFRAPLISAGEQTGSSVSQRSSLQRSSRLRQLDPG
ncbi:MAG: PIG-L family deacetylase [Candidatus Omnitrophica bacterium]|nr:PIG-L family deacetylase [Candidatus Omnitrophota bacterium]